MKDFQPGHDTASAGSAGPNVDLKAEHRPEVSPGASDAALRRFVQKKVISGASLEAAETFQPYFALVILGALSVGCASATAPLTNHVDNAHSADLVRLADRALSEILRPDYHRPFNGVEIRYASVRAQYLVACKAGEPRACWMVSQLRDPSGKWRDSSADELVTRNCRAGDSWSCRALVSPDESRRTIAKWPGWAGRSSDCYEDQACIATLHRECDAGFPISCLKAANVERSDERGRILEKCAAVLAIDGCTHGLLDECEELDRLRDVTSASDRSVGERLRCSMLGEHCEEASAAVVDPIARRDLSEHECQWWPSEEQRTTCAQLVKAYAAHEFPEPVPNRFIELRDWYCRKPVFEMPEICRDADVTRSIVGG